MPLRPEPHAGAWRRVWRRYAVVQGAGGARWRRDDRTKILQTRWDVKERTSPPTCFPGREGAVGRGVVVVGAREAAVSVGRLATRLALGAAYAPPRAEDDQNQPDDRDDWPDHGEGQIATHAAPLEDVEPLQRPDGADEDCQHAKDQPSPAHRSPPHVTLFGRKWACLVRCRAGAGVAQALRHAQTILPRAVTAGASVCATDRSWRTLQRRRA